MASKAMYNVLFETPCHCQGVVIHFFKLSKVYYIFVIKYFQGLHIGHLAMLWLLAFWVMMIGFHRCYVYLVFYHMVVLECLLRLVVKCFSMCLWNKKWALKEVNNFVFWKSLYVYTLVFGAYIIAWFLKLVELPQQI